MPSFKRRDASSPESPGSPSSTGGAKRESKPRSSSGSGGSGRSSSKSAKPAAQDTGTLEQWLAPSTSSSIDQIEVGLIDDGWEPERVGQAPLEATLAAIQAVGVVEPVLLRPRVGGRFEIVTGHRTVAAARSAGMDRVPSVVKDLDDIGALMALVFDGSASGQVTASGAAELRRRLHEAGAVDEDIEDVMAAVPVAEAPAELVGAGANGAAAAEAEAPAAEAPAAVEEAPVAEEAELVGAASDAEPAGAAEEWAATEELVPVAEPMLEGQPAPVVAEEEVLAAPESQPEPVAAAEAAPEAPAAEPEVLPEAPAPEPVAAEPVEEVAAAEPEPEPVPAEPAVLPEAAPEPQLVGAEDVPAPEAAPEPEPAVVAAAASARGLEPEGAAAAAAGRWLPLPAGRPRLARLSSAFADAPRMLRILAGDRFTGTAELVGRDGRKDAVAFLDGRILATYVEQGERRVDAPLRLPTPEQGPTVEITVRPHPRAVSVALGLALRSPARFTGLHAAFLHLDGLLALLRREGSDAACVVTSSKGAGVILLDAGQPIAAYARRWGDEPGEEAETTDVSAVLDMLVTGDGALDVHTGEVPEPLDLDDVIGRAVAGD